MTEKQTSTFTLTLERDLFQKVNNAAFERRMSVADFVGLALQHEIEPDRPEPEPVPVTPIRRKKR